MTARRIRMAGKRGERGYALLVVLFLVTLLVISTAAVAPNILTQGKREKEKEMIWRGKQYTRGVKLYYRKMGRFPTSIDDLTKPKIGSLRFMRQEYKDPMNKEDGSWRLIYVGPAGQLIGSLKPPRQNFQFPGAGAIGTPASALGGLNVPAQPGGAGGTSSTGLLGLGGTQSGGANSNTSPPGTTGPPVSADQGTPSSNGQGAGLGETPTIIGGNIIGVGSKIDRPSIIVYEKAKKYLLYEFIWDPTKDRVIGGQPGLQTGQPIGQPIGQQPGQNPGNPPQNPQQPQQNPPQQ